MQKYSFLIALVFLLPVSRLAQAQLKNPEQLEKFFLGEAGDNFLSKNKLVRLLLPPGTMAKVIKKRKLDSGAILFEAEILNAEMHGERVTFYYRDKKEFKFFDTGFSPHNPYIEIQSPDNASVLQAEERVPALQSFRNVRTKTATTKIINNVVFNNSRENVSKDFEHDENFDDWHVTAECTSKSSANYSVCIRQATGQLARFSIQNRGPNNVVARRGDVEGRTWSFIVNDFSRQAAAIRISDVPDAHNSNAQETALILFPRKVNQSIVVEKDQQIVTLATGEQVVFNRKTGEILRGALSETRGLGFHKPAIRYNGNGVLLRADNRGQDPRDASNVVISKKGFPECRVNSTEVFVKDGVSNNFKFARDEAFEEFLRVKCGFGFSPPDAEAGTRLPSSSQ